MGLEFWREVLRVERSNGRDKPLHTYPKKEKTPSLDFARLADFQSSRFGSTLTLGSQLHTSGPGSLQTAGPTEWYVHLEGTT